MTSSATAIQLQGMAPLLQVYDMPSSLRFYRDILGFQATMSSGEGDDVDWAGLKLGPSDLMLNTRYERGQRPAQPDPVLQSAHGDTTLYFGSPDIDGVYHQLKKAGIELDPPAITGYGWKAISFSDPDGYGICIHWPQEQES